MGEAWGTRRRTRSKVTTVLPPLLVAVGKSINELKCKIIIFFLKVSFNM